MNNPPVLVRTIADYRWNDALIFFVEENMNVYTVERNGMWEHRLVRDILNPTIVYQNTYREGNLILSEPVYIRDAEA
jgi:hypothetical protein